MFAMLPSSSVERSISSDNRDEEGAHSRRERGKTTENQNYHTLRHHDSRKECLSYRLECRPSCDAKYVCGVRLYD